MPISWLAWAANGCFFIAHPAIAVSPEVAPPLSTAIIFSLHLGGDIRYRVWRHFFVRPEAHLYHIVNNVEFHSDNVLRVGGSFGYTFGPK